jgi:hypothetical protein
MLPEDFGGKAIRLLDRLGQFLDLCESASSGYKACCRRSVEKDLILLSSINF